MPQNQTKYVALYFIQVTRVTGSFENETVTLVIENLENGFQYINLDWRVCFMMLQSKLASYTTIENHMIRILT